ncbi:MAG: hypothetical protein WCG73_02760, partial [Candidatus Moraniibacteriota bacterium]
GNMSTQRNDFPPEVQKEIQFLLDRFHYGERAKKLDEIVKVDEVVMGCPMSEEKFLAVVNKMLVEFKIV